MTDASEIWKSLPSYDGRYEMSSRGRIRSLYVQPKTKRDEPLILRQILEQRVGFYRVTLCHNGVQKTHLVHVLVAEAFLEYKPSPRSQVLHKDGILTNNRADNLTVSRRHGMKHTPEYSAWHTMIQRCTDKNRHSYARYGGRGISVHPPWRASFLQFLADVGPRPVGRSLDRINNDGNYEPGNVRWATKTEQARNRRQNTLVTINGRTQCLQAWAEEAGINKGTLGDRVKAGWPEHELLVPAGSLSRYRNVARLGKTSRNG